MSNITPFDFFDRFNNLLSPEPFPRQDWLPPVDIKETDAAYVLHMEVPGVRSEDLDVELNDATLTIRGARQSEDESTESGYVRRERHQGSFVRQFRVPHAVTADDLTAGMKDGVLEVTIPKKGSSASRRIPIK